MHAVEFKLLQCTQNAFHVWDTSSAKLKACTVNKGIIFRGKGTQRQAVHCSNTETVTDCVGVDDGACAVFKKCSFKDSKAYGAVAHDGGIMTLHSCSSSCSKCAGFAVNRAELEVRNCKSDNDTQGVRFSICAG